MIPEELLKKYNGKIEQYDSGDFVYEENTVCQNYFQIISGKIKLNNYSEDGKEFIQNIFEAPQCFGEVLLFVNERYPSNAITLTNTVIIKLSVQKFFKLLNDHPEYAVEINKNLSKRLYYKMIMSQHLFSKDPNIRLTVLMDYFKNSNHIKENSEDGYLIPLTRQQMANLTGLRVETVIRTIKLMEKNNLLKIKKRQIYY
ncbi:Crp/Fnr family transcriptional regulator [Chryseobacterium sp. ISL-6]|uniref:Crp/Fnr family transcriptional regulator n=1 Tax=Chryseobacterium sp. ISL-6 TaxID=2819143 RepID=UPI001BE93018|nr:Crp/Fnr family transcriptional regulator [Chryseobacterium sp. ISL-6]MBT2623607.1 Crp/Fnr family transcriptional regulator [Chryseobacterium sp. ISL-6]